MLIWTTKDIPRMECKEQMKTEASQDSFEVMQICTSETKIATGSTDFYSQFQHLHLRLQFQSFLKLQWTEWQKESLFCTPPLRDWASAGLILCSCPGRKPDPSDGELWAEQEEFWHPHKQDTLGQGKAQKISRCPTLLSYVGFVRAKVRSIQWGSRNSNETPRARPWGRESDVAQLHSSPRTHGFTYLT